MLCMVWGFLLWGGCGSSPKTPTLLTLGTFLMCLGSTSFWAMGALAFLAGSHGEALVCRPLYDRPDYGLLTDLFDAGGVLYEAKGLLGHYLRGNGSVRVKDVLR